MTKKKKPITSYAEVIKSLRDIIKAEYPDGGWLPGGREMAKHLNVGLSSYYKAIGFLESEGMMNVVPKKGHYVYPNALQTKKIGLIIHTGQENAFIHDKHFLAAALTCFDEADFDIQTIHGNSIEAISENAISYGVKGIICFFPTPSLWNDISQLEENTGLPVVTVNYRSVNDPTPEHTVVAYDDIYGFQRRFRTMLDRGHKSFMYIGNFESVKTGGIDKMLLENGIEFTEEMCFTSIWKNQRKFARQLKKLKPTCIVSEGNYLELTNLFEVISELPEKSSPEVYVTYFAHLKDIYKQFPKVKLVANTKRPKQNLGQIAAELLIEHLNSRKELNNIFVKYDF